MLQICCCCCCCCCFWGAVGTPTRYRQDGSEFEPRYDEITHARPDRPWAPPSLLYNRYRVSLPGVKRPGRALTTQPHQAPRLKKEWSCTRTPIIAFMTCCRVNFTFFLPRCIFCDAVRSDIEFHSGILHCCRFESEKRHCCR
jgi:hypothetical protein